MVKKFMRIGSRLIKRLPKLYVWGSVSYVTYLGAMYAIGYWSTF